MASERTLWIQSRIEEDSGEIDKIESCILKYIQLKIQKWHGFWCTDQ